MRPFSLLIRSLLIFSLIFCSCTSGTNTETDHPIITSEFIIEKLAYGMSSEDVIEILGEPVSDVGSAMHDYVYDTGEMLFYIHINLENKLDAVRFHDKTKPGGNNKLKILTLKKKI